MLSQKYTLNDVIVIKLVSGEEIIGRFQSESSLSITISKAFSISAQNTPQGLALGLTPALMVSEPTQNIDIEKNAIAIRSKPPFNHPIVQEFQQQTSGIVLGTGKSL